MNKYRAQKVSDDGILFDSKAEHKRYCELKLMARAGLITELRVHDRFPLEIDGKHVGTYVADFTYQTFDASPDMQCWIRHVEDVKGVRTALYKFKRKVFEACHSPLKIEEIAA